MNTLKTQVRVQFVIILLLVFYLGWREFVDEAPPSGVKEASMENDESRKEEMKGTNKLPNYQAFIVPTPEELTFAGEKIVLKEPDLRERFDREIHVNANWHSNTILMIKRSHRWMAQISEVLKKNNVPDDFKYIVAIESNFEENARSHRNAVGFWQLLEGTAEQYGLEVNNEVDERRDPVKATEAACKYLHDAYDKFGDWTSVAASYNVGMRGLERRLDEQKVDSYFDVLLNDETSRYMFRILAAKAILENPGLYGFNIPVGERYRQPEFDTVKVEETIPDLVDFAHKHGITYKTLKRYNPWLRDRDLTVKNNTYEILISKDPLEQHLVQKLTK
ncbi:lytic transglycosylase domain-containing protein [Porifericola rhodea]|uniref:lytic transglycosylase domain-containing protein n=1 Tax=Porifericola rhodea TaxID=930972 RepID=UPI002666C104|nr:lytic transglycosylase domain-containing protein [Porifericola rhodea]WKN33630.1 lytic transglycosylase domain-containing protein [Porifericola rhodea]